MPSAEVAAHLDTCDACRASAHAQSVARTVMKARAAQLARTSPARAQEVEAARARLTDDDAMGTLFRAMAWVHPDWADPAGFGV